MIEFILNGKPAATDREPSSRLLDILREDFCLTGVKEGCGEGECGACSVLIDGRLANSCLVAVGSLHGARIVTIEGFRDTEKFALLDQAFAKAGAVQCGFCTPGMVMAAEALLSRNAHPTEEQVREAISGNLCRCTGYNMIVDAIMNASERGNGLW